MKERGLLREVGFLGAPCDGGLKGRSVRVEHGACVTLGSWFRRHALRMGKKAWLRGEAYLWLLRYGHEAQQRAAWLGSFLPGAPFMHPPASASFLPSLGA